MAPQKVVVMPQARSMVQLASQSGIVFELGILALIFLLAFSTRLFSVLRYESVIHEFDPWFNFRSTKYLVKEGFYAFHNWFDDQSWYPLGRFVGGTVYPGLMYTAALLFHALRQLNLPVNIRNVCVFLAPLFAGNTSVATYLLTREAYSSSAGIIAAAFIALAPGYISRSVAGSYDNEAVAIFALTITFYFWCKAVNSGSMLDGAACALCYFYMVMAWGGYIFIINLIPLHVMFCMLLGLYTTRMYVAYCSFYILGTLLSMQVVFVSFQPVSSPEHFAAFAVLCFLQLYHFFHYVKTLLRKEQMAVLIRLSMLAVAGGVAALIVASLLGLVPALTGRFKSLIGSTSNIAIVKSVSEHQPSAWSTFFFDLHMTVFLVPPGLYYCHKRLSPASMFVVLFVITASYFSSIMVRLVLVLAPASCIVAGIGTHVLLDKLMMVISYDDAAAIEVASVVAKATASSSSASVAAALKKPKRARVSKTTASVVVGGLALTLAFYVTHCTWVTSTAYSSPSVVLQARQQGHRIIFDDFREAYTWLRHNTKENSRILSWWDYGYQITGMGNRTVIVDNNTRNNTHIATVGMVFASNEEKAFSIMRKLDVQYVLVIFGGMIGYSSDDINKFLWMVRISAGVFPDVVENDFFSAEGRYAVDQTASSTMLQSLMYKTCFYRFSETQTEYGRPRGFDRVRNVEIHRKPIRLTHMEEAFTSEHWMVRIYRLLPPRAKDKFRASKRDPARGNK